MDKGQYPAAAQWQFCTSHASQREMITYPRRLYHVFKTHVSGCWCHSHGIGSDWARARNVTQKAVWHLLILADRNTCINSIRFFFAIMFFFRHHLHIRGSQATAARSLLYHFPISASSRSGRWTLRPVAGCCQLGSGGCQRILRNGGD